MVTTNYSKRSNDISKTFALLAIFIGLLSVIGWVFDISILKAILPDLIPIKFNTAFCILLLGIVAFSFSKRDVAKNRIYIYIMTALVIAISFLTLLQYMGNYDFGIDQLIFTDTEASYIKPGRMSFTSSVMLFFTAMSFILHSLRTFNTFAGVLRVANVFIGLLALLGYLYGASGLLFYLPYKTISPQAVIALLCLNLSLLFSDRNSAIMRPFLSPQIGGVVGRKLLPLSIATLIGIGFGVRELTQYFNIDDSVDGVVVVTLSLLLFSFGKTPVVLMPWIQQSLTSIKPFMS